jgi:hypothetical protein
MTYLEQFYSCASRDFLLRVLAIALTPHVGLYAQQPDYQAFMPRTTPARLQNLRTGLQGHSVGTACDLKNVTSTIATCDNAIDLSNRELREYDEKGVESLALRLHLKQTLAHDIRVREELRAQGIHQSAR